MSDSFRFETFNPLHLGKRHWKHLLLITITLLQSFSPFCAGHDSLYNYVEIRLGTSGDATVDFSVHGPELAADYGVDPLETGTGWLDALTDEQIDTLFKHAGEFVLHSFRVEDEDKNLLSPENLRFPTPSETKHSWESQEGARPGSIVGSLHLDRAPGVLTIHYSDAAKRLMLVISRPGKFPKVYDIEPNQTMSIPLFSTDQK